jgi:flagellar basal-body rod protein FlgB
VLGGLLDSVSLRAARMALSGLSRRQEAIADNIANIDTPGYQRHEVTFERALEASINRSSQQTSLVTTHPRHLAGGGRGSGENPNVVTPRSLVASRNDGNAVDIDEEMALLAETQIRFQALSQSIGRRLSTLRTVIRG